MNELIRILSTEMWAPGPSAIDSLRALAAATLRELLASERLDAEHTVATLVVIGPTGAEETVCEIRPGGDDESEEPRAEAELRSSFEIFEDQGAERVLVARVDARGTGTFSVRRMESQGFLDLGTIARAFRQCVLQQRLRSTRTDLRREGTPAKLRQYEELGQPLTVFKDAIVRHLGGYGILCYLRRSYLPRSSASDLVAEAAIHVPEAARRLASEVEWQGFWDRLGERRIDRKEVGTFPAEEAGGVRHHGLPLSVPEARPGASPEDPPTMHRFFGALSVFSGPRHGYLGSEIALLQTFAADLAYIVRDCEIFHSMGLHDQLLFDLNLIPSPARVLERAAKWYQVRYRPTEIAILRLTGYRLSLVYNYGVNPDSLPALDIRKEPGAVLSCARDRRIDYMPDTEDEPNYLRVNSATRSQIAVPLYIGEIVLGVLLLGFPVVDALSTADILLISASSFRIASALLSAQRAEQGALVAHKLKELLPLFRDNLAQVAAETGEGERPRRAIQRMQSLIETWEPRIRHLVRTLSQETAGAAVAPRRVERFGLKKLLEELAAAARVEATTRNVEVRIEVVDTAPAPRAVHGDRESIRLALDSLVANSIDAIAKGGGASIALRISERTSRGDLLKRNRRFAVVTVADDGPGVSPQDAPSVFEPLFSTKGGSSTGLGLFIAQGILEGAGGTLELLMPEGPGAAARGATFEATLPLEEE